MPAPAGRTGRSLGEEGGTADRCRCEQVRRNGTRPDGFCYCIGASACSQRDRSPDLPGRQCVGSVDQLQWGDLRQAPIPPTAHQLLVARRNWLQKERLLAAAGRRHASRLGAHSQPRETIDTSGSSSVSAGRRDGGNSRPRRRGAGDRQRKPATAGCSAEPSRHEGFGPGCAGRGGIPLDTARTSHRPWPSVIAFLRVCSMPTELVVVRRLGFALGCPVPLARFLPFPPRWLLGSEAWGGALMIAWWAGRLTGGQMRASLRQLRQGPTGRRRERSSSW